MCPLTQGTPTTKTPTGGLIARFFSRGTKESSKRLIAGVSAGVLCLIAVALAEALSYQAHRNWTVSVTLAGSLALVAGYVMWLAKQIYLKPETDETKPGTENEGQR